MFTGHQEITDKSQPVPFEQYLLVDTDYGHRSEVYGLGDDTPLDIETLLNEIYAEHGYSVSLQNPPICGPNYAAIITDGRAPDSVVVWQHADFYLDE